MEFTETGQHHDTDVTSSGGTNDNFKAVLEKLFQDKTKTRERSQIPTPPPRQNETENPLENPSHPPSAPRCGVARHPSCIKVLPPPPSRAARNARRPPDNMPSVCIPRPLRVPPPPPLRRLPQTLIADCEDGFPILPARTNDANGHSSRPPLPPPRINDTQKVSTFDGASPPPVVIPRLVPPPRSNQQPQKAQRKSSRPFPVFFGEKEREEASCDAQENTLSETTGANEASMNSPEVVERERFDEADVDAYMFLEPALAALKIGLPVEEVRRAVKEKLEETGFGFASGDDLIENVLKQEEDHNVGTPRQIGETEIELCLKSESALAALNLGLSLWRVKHAIRDKLERTGCGFSSGMALIEATLNVPENEEDLLLERRKNKHPVEDRVCKICMDEEICVVFIPCGHLITCMDCSKDLKTCPICRCPIQSTVRTFLP